MLARIAFVAIAMIGCETERGLLIEINSPVGGDQLQVIVAGTHLVPDDGQATQGRWLDLGPVAVEDVVGRDLAANPYRYLITGAAETPDSTPVDGELLIDDDRVVVAAVLYEAGLPIAYGVVPLPLGIPTDYVALHRLPLVPAPANFDPNCFGRGPLIVGTDPACNIVDDCTLDPNGANCPEPCVDDPPIGNVVYEVCDGRDNNCAPGAQHTPNVLCYTNLDGCSLGLASCDDLENGQGVIDNCAVIGAISPTTQTGSFEPVTLCSAYDNCSGSPDRVACAHSILAEETLVCEPRYDQLGPCDDFHPLSKNEANDCTLSILGNVSVPGWNPTIDGGDTSSALACAVVLGFEEPEGGGLSLHSEALLVRSFVDNGMLDVQDFVRVIIAPKMAPGCPGGPIDACVASAP